MPKSTDTAEKKLKEGKKAARKADQVKAKNATKAGAAKLLTNMASNMTGAGEAKEFLAITNNLDSIDAQIKVLNTAKRGKRGRLKEMKVNMESYDLVRKLRKKDPEDAKAFMVTTALYQDQLAMPLTDAQKQSIADLQKRRDDSRAAMIGQAGGNDGKEVGSGTDVPADEAAAEGEEAPAAAAAPAVPARNENLNQFRAAVPAGAH